MDCIYCHHKKLYELKSGQLKCSACKRKFSPKKNQTDGDVIECFCNNLTANQTAKKLNLNYVSVKKRYELLRKLITQHSEDSYQDKQTQEYDEYVYLQQSKKNIKKYIFDAQNFLTFAYDDKVYNLLMPDLSMYKNQYVDESVKDAYFKEFSKFMMMNKISKTKKRDNLITKFWIFFEDSILKYKGVSNENFIYYLKEIEFKFNYLKNKQHDILLRLYKG